MCISEFSKCELLALSNTLSLAIAKDLSPEDLATLAAFFTLLGDILALLAIEDVVNEN